MAEHWNRLLERINAAQSLRADGGVALSEWQDQRTVLLTLMDKYGNLSYMRMACESGDDVESIRTHYSKSLGPNEVIAAVEFEGEG